MQDAQAEFPEVKSTAQTPEPQVEKSGEFKPVTAEELDFLHDFNKDPGLTERLKQLKQEDPQTYERYQNIDTRRVEELRKLEPPELSRNHQEGLSETEMKKTGGYMQVSFEEINNRLQEMKSWMAQWGGLSKEQKLARYNRMKEVQQIRSIPAGDMPKEQYETGIAAMEKRERNIIQDVERRVRGLDYFEFDNLKQLFDGNPSVSEKVTESWSFWEKHDVDQYNRLRKIYDRFQKELELKEPPFTVEPSRLYDLKPVRINRVLSREIDQMDLPELQTLLERSEAFSERWDKLSDAQRIEQLKRVRELKGVLLLEGEREGIRPYLKEGETVERKGVEFWTSGTVEQIKNLQEAIAARETQKQQQELEPTRAAIEEVSHGEVSPAPPETPPPPPPPPAPRRGFFGRIFGRK